METERREFNSMNGIKIESFIKIDYNLPKLKYHKKKYGFDSIIRVEQPHFYL